MNFLRRDTFVFFCLRDAERAQWRKPTGRYFEKQAEVEEVREVCKNNLNVCEIATHGGNEEEGILQSVLSTFWLEPLLRAKSQEPRAIINEFFKRKESIWKRERLREGKMDWKKVVEKVMQYVLTLSEEEFSDLTIGKLGKVMQIDRIKLERHFKNETRMPLGDFLMREKMTRAAFLLVDGRELTVREVGEQVGFRTYDYFVKIFKRHFGLLPSLYRKFKVPRSGVKDRRGEVKDRRKETADAVISGAGDRRAGPGERRMGLGDRRKQDNDHRPNNHTNHYYHEGSDRHGEPDRLR